MALVYKRLVEQDDGSVNDYQVRNAGKSLRLYRNGVFHTQYHPERIVTGDIWELMLIASLGLPLGARVLVLGAGGGAIVNLLQHFVKPKQIDLVDLDGTNLYLAKRFFLRETANVNLIESDAKLWLEKTSKRKKPPAYDLIIEDLFGEEAGQPLRAFTFDKAWMDLLCNLLKKDGRLVLNFESSRQLNESPAIKYPKLLKSQGFISKIKLSSPRYQNNMALLARSEITSSDIRSIILHDQLLKRHSKDYFLRSL